MNAHTTGDTFEPRSTRTPRMPAWAEQVAVFDTETTGVDTQTARVVSATLAVLQSSGEVVERYDWLIDPGIEIPAAATRVHGISTQVARESGMRADAGIAQMLRQLESLIDRGFPLVVYNAPYDLSLMRAEAERYGAAWPTQVAPVLDPLILDKQFDRYRKGKRTLEVVAPHYGVEIGTAHDAGDDAIAAGRVLQALALKYADVLPADTMELHDTQIVWAREQAQNFQEYMRRVRDANFVADGSWPIR